MDFSEHTIFVSLGDSILRLPLLMVMDSLLINASIVIPSADPCDNKLGNIQLDCLQDNSWFMYCAKFFFQIFTYLFGWALVYAIGFSAINFFLLPTASLLSFYVGFSSIALVYWSTICYEEFFSHILEQGSHLFFDLASLDITTIKWFTRTFVVQIFLSTLFSFAIPRELRSNLSNAISYLFYLPIITPLVPGLTREIAKWISRGSSALIFVYLIFILICRIGVIVLSIFLNIKWSRRVVRHYGVYTLFETQWARLQIPKVLKIYWLMRFFGISFFLIAKAAKNYRNGPDDSESPFTMQFFEDLLKESLVRGCETFIALLGMSSVIGSIFAFVAVMIRSFLRIEDSEINLGTVSGVLFVILALQTNLTGLEPPQRYPRLNRNLGLMISACLHFLHKIVHPVLLSLGASHSRNISKHIRALLLCVALVTLSSLILYFSWTNNSLSTWLVALTLFQAELIMKVIITLSLYLLLMIDSYRIYEPEKLDDCVYYLKATGKTIDFIFGILILLNGCFILIWEACGILRAITVCIHAYFNIWMQAKSGWNAFLKRRSAAKKLEATREATASELQELDDVCSICFQKLASARITRCDHYFHEFCLRKWLYIQDVCPLCHRSLCDQEKVTHPNASTSNLNTAS